MEFNKDHIVNVTAGNLEECTQEIYEASTTCIDLETTGLKKYGADRDKIVSMSVSISPERHFYFHFNTFLNEKEVIPLSFFDKIKINPKTYIIVANAQFEIAFLGYQGIDISKNKIWDILTIEHIMNSNSRKCSVDYLGSLYGFPKINMKDICKKNKWYEYQINSKGKKEIVPQYKMIPFEQLKEYNCNDTFIELMIAKQQIKKFRALNADYNRANETIPNPLNLARDREQAFIPAHCNMEKNGLLIDVAQIEECRKLDNKELIRLYNKYYELTGEKYVASAKAFQPIFDKFKIPYNYTDIGNPSFEKKDLAQINHVIPQTIVKIKDKKSRVDRYYDQLLYYADSENKIYANFRVNSAKTYRMATKDPNLLNIPKNSEKGKDVIPIRKCFIAEPDYIIVSIDYDQMELKYVLDQVEEMDMINRIQNGLDVHTATADICGVERSQAKAVNFGIIYGMGVSSLAPDLGLSIEETEIIYNKVTSGMPKVMAYSSYLKRKAKITKRTVSPFGHVYVYDDWRDCKNALNYNVQGPSADIIKDATIEINELLEDKKSYLSVSIYDELIFQIHKTEINIVPQIKKIMDESYKYKHLPLTTSASFSLTDWHDLYAWNTENLKKFGIAL